MAFPLAEEGFAQGEAVRVVLQPHRNVELLPKPGRKGKIPEREIRRSEQGTGALVQRPGGADAYTVHGGPHRADCCADLLENAVGRTAAQFPRYRADDAATDERRADGAASEIDGNHFLASFWSSSWKVVMSANSR